MNKFYITFFVSLFLFVPLLSFGQDCNPGDGKVFSYKTLVNLGGLDCISSPGAYLNAIYEMIIGLAGFLAVVMIMYGGVLYMFAAGNEGQVTKAKDHITNAVIGLILALSSFLILQTINPDLTDLNVKLGSVVATSTESTSPITGGLSGTSAWFQKSTVFGIGQDECNEVDLEGYSLTQSNKCSSPQPSPAEDFMCCLITKIETEYCLWMVAGSAPPEKTCYEKREACMEYYNKALGQGRILASGTQVCSTNTTQAPSGQTKNFCYILAPQTSGGNPSTPFCFPSESVCLDDLKDKRGLGRTTQPGTTICKEKL